MLVKLSNKDIFKENPELNSITQFKALTDKDMKYIVLVYDYESIMRKLPLSDRKLKAGIRAGWKTEVRENGKVILDKNGRDKSNGKIPRIESAIKAYNEIQYDSPREMVKAWEVQIDEYRKFLLIKNKSLEQLEKADKIMKAHINAIDMLKELKVSLGLEDEVDNDDNDGKSLSAIDKFNKDRYKV